MSDIDPSFKSGDIVWVAAQPGRGISWKAVIEDVKDNKAKVRPLTIAGNRPAWSASTRARWVKTIMLRQFSSNP